MDSIIDNYTQRVSESQSLNGRPNDLFLTLKSDTRCREVNKIAW